MASSTSTSGPADTGPIAARPARAALLPRPRARRLVQLFAGLYLFGLGAALQLESGLGLDPWTVLHQGLSLRTGLSVGTWTVIVGALVMLLWIPLRQRPGLGTLCNVLALGPAVDVSLWLLPEPQEWPWRWAFLLLGIVVVAVGSGCYIGAGLGPGPRDGLMTGLAARGVSPRLARTAVELAVLAVGFLLGGTVGIGTLLFALGIGPIVQFFLRRLTVSAPQGPR
ncbi:YczE/YyaS/YitT family protein [Allonocardiopsis opalescens]|uniref:Putative membrane protein YczE n=1 Tax=Allonocardiopsis opalescens TaxID=1144618 RepID=A0A2T0Q4B0_9ACTN|nr:hypothetical protein [Allonocardiopsis opalescens]PRX98609.1 putative membrane protein YczE [Allonocardiopsis opalescens]